MKNHKGTSFVLSVASLLLFASPAFSMQGRPGGAGQGGQGQRPKTTQRQGQMGSSRGTVNRQRIRATDQQRDQLRNCTQTADRIRQQAREMDRLGKAKTFDPGKARQQRDQIREQLRTMEQQHEQLMNGMNADQQAALRNRVEEMNQIRQRVNNHLGRLDEELGKPDPNAKQVRENAQQISREMNRWKSQYQAMESEMGVSR